MSKRRDSPERPHHPDHPSGVAQGGADAAPEKTPARVLLELQQTVGNAAVGKYLERVKRDDASDEDLKQAPKVELATARAAARASIESTATGDHHAKKRRPGGLLHRIDSILASFIKWLKALFRRLVKGLPARVDPSSLQGRRSIAYHHYRKRGLTSAQAAGLVGNLQQESGGRLDPTQGEIGDGGGIGIAQWTDPSRQQALYAFANKRHRSWKDYETQVAFVWEELTGTYASALDALKKAKSLRAATSIVMNQYETPDPSLAHFPVRLGFAEAILKDFGN